MEKKFLDYEGLQELVLKLKEYIGDAGKLEFKGTVANVAGLPALNTQKVGWMWTIQNEGKTTSEFVEGSGKTIAANSEVAAVKVSGTSTNSVWSIDGGTSYVNSAIAAYVPAGTLGSATLLAKCYVATSSDAGLVEDALYATNDDGSSFYKVTGLADTFAEFTKEQEADETALETLNTLFTGDSFVDLNLYTETKEEDVMKWVLIGPVFDVSDKLTFTTTTMPAGVDGLVVMYLGETTFIYTEVTPEGSENPKALGWYVANRSGGYVLTEDETVQPGTTYYTKNEQYVQGVVYQYDETEGKYLPLNSGDTMVAITNEEIDALFV